jgi:hypothetical protein
MRFGSETVVFSQKEHQEVLYPTDTTTHFTEPPSVLWYRKESQYLYCYDFSRMDANINLGSGTPADRPCACPGNTFHQNPISACSGEVHQLPLGEELDNPDFVGFEWEVRLNLRSVQNLLIDCSIHPFARAVSLDT